MNALSTALRYEIWFLLLGLVAVVLYQMVTGRINTKGLLNDTSGNRGFSPGRLQLLIFTLGGALYYLMLAFDRKGPAKLPELPTEFLLAMGGSHLFYLGGKLFSVLAERFGFLSSPHGNRRV